MLNKKGKLVVISILLIIGLLIYFLLAKDTYVSKIFFGLIHVNVIIPDSKLLTIVRNYIPDFVWILAFELSMSLLTDDVIISTMIPLIVGIIFEILQLLEIINGTFDIYDIFIELFASILLGIMLKREKSNEKQN